MSLAYPIGYFEDDQKDTEFDPGFGDDAWDYEVDCEQCKHWHGGEEECLPELQARPTPCGDPRCCP